MLSCGCIHLITMKVTPIINKMPPITGNIYIIVHNIWVSVVIARLKVKLISGSTRGGKIGIANPGLGVSGHFRVRFSHFFPLRPRPGLHRAWFFPFLVIDHLYTASLAVSSRCEMLLRVRKEKVCSSVIRNFCHNVN